MNEKDVLLWLSTNWFSIVLAGGLVKGWLFLRKHLWDRLDKIEERQSKCRFRVRVLMDVHNERHPEDAHRFIEPQEKTDDPPP